MDLKKIIEMAEMAEMIEASNKCQTPYSSVLDF